MHPKRFLWRLYLSYVGVVFVALIVMCWYATGVMRELSISHTRNDLTDFARTLVSNYLPEFTKSGSSVLEEEVRKLGQTAKRRITLIRADGIVMADSEHEPQTMENHSNRPEVREALSGQPSDAIRFSSTLQKQMLYVAYPVFEGKKVLGIVRVALPLLTISDTLLITDRRLLAAALAISLASTILAYFAYRKMVAPLQRLKEGAVRYARGDFAFRIFGDESQEMRELSEAMNEMAKQLDSRIKTILHQSREQEAVLSSMVEGVLAVDRDEKLLKVNSAGASFLGGSKDGFTGKTVAEVVRSSELQKFIRLALSSNQSIEQDLTLIGPFERYVKASASPLLNSEEDQLGVLIVLHDITKLRRLEGVRRDFVANVSHELRTPITSIKGSVDTLLEGALDDKNDARKFVEVIARHADRLNRIVEDLLSLARLEDSSAEDTISFESVDLISAITAAVEICQQKANQKGISVSVACKPGNIIRANVMLLEQAVVNLLTNAIDYSEEKSEVKIEAEFQENGIFIHVKDTGCGIAAVHLPRLFERFYRVDRARSRKSGGTGLGLSIVKHIAQVHGGRATVDSVVGEGSTFSIYLPNSLRISNI